MSKILLSYRREDSIDVTGRIYDRLAKDFTPDAVFMDVDSIPYSVDFRTYLDEQVSQCEVFLAVIGRDWLRGKERKGRSRLEDPRDFVRIEIESALKRRIPVIPVLVGGASVPPAHQLPASIQDLSYRHAVVIRPNPDFHRDMDRLIDHLRIQLAREREQLVPQKAQSTASGVSGAEGTGHPKVDEPGGETVEANTRSSQPDSREQEVEPRREEHAASSAASQQTTNGARSYLLGGISLIVLIGAVVVFLILQPTFSPVDSPRVIEKKEERQAQVIPLSSPSSPVEPAAVPAKQVTPVIENKPTKAVKKKEEPAGRKRPSSPSSPPEPVVVPQKQDVPVEKPVTATQPSIPTPEMVRIPPGSFTMGESVSVGQTPIHQIQFAKPFAMARYETTYDEYDRFTQATGRRLLNDKGWGRGRRPVIGVSWQNANDYAQWLSQQTGQRYRLPTEAEWEYAARSGGMDETWAGTSDESRLKEYAVYLNKGGTEPVGSKKPNGLGLYDMSGNVWEWVQDCWHKGYTGAPSDGSAWREADEGNCDLRMIRGASWNDSPHALRATHRYINYTNNQYDYVGFRLVQDLP